jgi:OPT family oligopeptide transporter
MSEPTAPVIDKENPTFDLSSVPADERDKAWYEHYYRGDDVPQLTVRAVVMGGVIGMAMAFSNLYATLKLGWAFGVAITASVLSFSIWKLFVKTGVAKTDMTILENNCMQSTASAAGYSTGGTIATAVGAHLLISGDEARLHWIPVTAWVFLVAVLGVFLAIPMKRQMINREQLPFPSGIAAAETLRSLYAKGGEAAQKARSLILAMFTGVGVAFARAFHVVPEEISLAFLKVGVRGKNIALTGTQLGMNFEVSLLLLAAGVLTGMRVSASMFGASVINYLFVIPEILALPDWAVETGKFLGHVEVVRDGGEIVFVKVTKWSLWFGTSLMVAAGLTSFAMGWKTIVRAIVSFGKKKEATTESDMLASIEVPTSWMVIGLVPTAIGLAVVSAFAFDMNVFLGLLSVGLSFFLALVACRATGETDTTPIGAMGKITQFAYAILAKGNITANLMSAGITAGAAGSSADLLTDLKSGYLLGANPRKQFLAQFVGLFFGVVAIVPAWYLLVPNKAALEAFNPPATNMWHAVAEALSQGIHTIPMSARYAIAVGGILGIALPLIEFFSPAKVRRFLPSSMGIGLAFVVPFQNAFSFFLGAVLYEIWKRAKPAHAEKYSIPVASGAVAGESLAAALVAIVKNFL